MTDKERKELKEQLSKKLKGYSNLSKLARAAGAITIGGAAVTAPLLFDMPFPFSQLAVEAAIVHVDIPDVTITSNDDFGLDLDDGGVDVGFNNDATGTAFAYGNNGARACWQKCLTG